MNLYGTKVEDRDSEAGAVFFHSSQKPIGSNLAGYYLWYCRKVNFGMPMLSRPARSRIRDLAGRSFQDDGIPFL